MWQQRPEIVAAKAKFVAAKAWKIVAAKAKRLSGNVGPMVWPWAPLSTGT